MQKFSNMSLSEVASAAAPAARRVAVPTAKPASLSAEALNIPRSGIRDVFDRVERVPDAISLTVGEPSATAAPHLVAAACEAAQAGRTRYTNVLGVPEYRKAVADYSARVKGLTYDPETEIQAVDGATIGLFLALKAVVGTGDEVIIPSPFFTSYDAEVMLCGGRPVTVALRPEHGMRVNAADIEAAITPRTRAVIINSPGNPTGAVTSAAELARIAEVCKQHNIWAISDEVYHPFVFGETFGETLGGEAAVAPSIAAVPGMKDRTIVVESLSKTYAMTGWRIGYLLAPEAVIEQTGKIAELMHSSVNSLAFVKIWKKSWLCLGSSEFAMGGLSRRFYPRPGGARTLRPAGPGACAAAAGSRGPCRPGPGRPRGPPAGPGRGRSRGCPRTAPPWSGGGSPAAAAPPAATGSGRS